MTINLKMPNDFKVAYKKELQKYKDSLAQNNDTLAWHHLERAHIIGQYHPVSHTGVHFRMFVFGIRKFDLNEILGQFVRMSFGWIGSMFNRIPVGNTGSASVPIFAPMPIPDDLKPLLWNADVDAKGLSGFKSK
ncbi:DUF3703 domain-containing protein [Leptospira meyeri]|uniref:DUF3703 domain-containing protein n=1 Tax=Leptospira meyeri TaxID=29508 RepID=UPI000C29C4E0|nr:DUF3703 domain-containing protein [Leptospira meyeri]PKA26034.1 hypothetical protein CH381_12700 [Leptospira sp. mixed culture ATI2-C-A1]MCW7488066.1 DUF3703 domain-containing protein [Leptospira meyeri]PJZ81625.1 hypothetical protein CH359_06495 [Leptospira meyeri]PJZ97127.1 hypothetical protein CH358_08165 [Leptospira meyeri]PKA11274.1 hypothetical protein CH372_15035 [Leptospira meyeri]